ncbi:hypothetical protein AAFN85_20095 [Mucilaginibacter sp. CAU 1740]|uniref:hypothetical protein n=1 Tax=Mucilaginibacter sp. CAU 1740 TaxID=3140365 RepID=UPI00325BBB60
MMSLKDKYQIDFIKDERKVKPNICVQKNPGHYENSHLHFLDLLDANECRGFIYDLDSCIDGQSNVDEGFRSDSVDNQDIRYCYPNVVINDILTIPMVDMRGLLQEWLDFINY